jgi:tetratricopeptide (TPR) repeat protein
MSFRVPRIRAVASLAIGIVSFVPLAFSQRGGTAGPATGTTAPPGGGIGTNNPSPGIPGNNPGNNPGQYPNNTTNPNNRFPDQTRPIYLSGKVMLDDGTPPPGPVTIERVCNGNPRAQGYTDSKGRFSFQLGQTQGIMQDASVGSGGMGGAGGMPGGMSGNRPSGGFGDPSSGQGSRDLMGCEIRANLPGFRSDSINLGTRRVFDNPDLGTIILHRLANVEGVSISMVSLLAPKDAKKAFDKGLDLLKKNKDAEAEKSFDKAVEIYPKYSTAWFELGKLKEAQKDVEGARKDYAQALAADPKYINPYRQLVGISVKEQNWKDVSDTSNRLIKLDPVDFPDAYFYNAVANYYLKNWDEAEKNVREAQKLDPNNRMPKTLQLLGAILAEKQDYAGAAEQMKKYLALVPEGQESELAKKQLADLEKMAVAK